MTNENDWQKRALEAEAKLGQIQSAKCRECSGSGEIGLADGDVVCPICYGSGDPTKPGPWRRWTNETNPPEQMPESKAPEAQKCPHPCIPCYVCGFDP